MIYEYKCDQCETSKDVVKSVKDYDTPETCEKCQNSMRKVFSISRPLVDSMEPEYYHSLGTVIKTKRQKREIMKAKGLIEVGNEKVNTVHQAMDNQRKTRLREY